MIWRKKEKNQEIGCFNKVDKNKIIVYICYRNVTKQLFVVLIL